MKKIFILFLFLIAAISLNAQVEIEWQKCYGGTIIDRAASIIQSNDGGFIFVGSTMSVNGDVIGNHNNDSIFDCWVVKTSATGNIQWQKCLGGTGADFGYSIQQTNDGGYVMAGYTESNNGDVSGYHGGGDIWVVKLSFLGDILWQKCYGGTDYESATSILQTSDGGYIVVGNTNSNNGDVSGNNGQSDMWVLKIDVQGNIVWQTCLGGTFGEVAESIQQTNDGGYIMAGYTESNDGDVSGNNGDSDMWVVKLDFAGNIEWQKCYGGSDLDIASCIKLTVDGGYIVAGTTWSNDGDVSGNHGAYDMWVLKIDVQGNIQWQKCLGGPIEEWAFSIQQTIHGGYIIAGITESNTGDFIENNGESDMWVVKLDVQGNIEWHKCLGGNILDYAYSVQQISDEGYIVLGITQSNDGDITENHGMTDLWVVKLVEPNISGRVFHDINENGIKDIGEQGVAGHLVRMTPANHYTYTNNNGYYYFHGDTGVFNTVSYMPQQYWYETTNNYNYYINLDSLSQVVDTFDYAVNTSMNVNDVSISLIGTLTGTMSLPNYWLTYKNLGTVTANGTIEFKYDPLLTYNTSTLAPVSHVGNTLAFAYDTLGSGVQRMFRVNFQVVGVQNLGDTLHSFAMITPLVPDTFVTNNYDTLRQVITGSYDPNDKTVSPAGYGSQGMVLHGQRLTYTIRFQNTGTDTAFTVVIRDTLDADLDIETFVVEANSHSVTWQLHSGNELFFTFQNILLPDSNVNEPGSNGFIRYSISPKAGLADGTTATNTSYIFFDNNPAVVTNTTLNTFVTNIPVTSPVLEVLKTLVFPNPSSDFVYINLPEFTRKVEVYNLNGEMVQQQVPQKPVAEINIKELPAGVYVVKMKCSKGVVTTKFVKE